MLLVGVFVGLGVVCLWFAFRAVEATVPSQRKIPPIRSNAMFRAGRASVKPAMSVTEIVESFPVAYEHRGRVVTSDRPTVKEDLAL